MSSRSGRSAPAPARTSRRTAPPRPCTPPPPAATSGPRCRARARATASAGPRAPRRWSSPAAAATCSPRTGPCSAGRSASAGGWQPVTAATGPARPGQRLTQPGSLRAGSRAGRRPAVRRAARRDTTSGLVLVCTSPATGATQAKTVYTSADNGQTWQKAADRARRGHRDLGGGHRRGHDRARDHGRAPGVHGRRGVLGRGPGRAPVRRVQLRRDDQRRRRASRCRPTSRSTPCGSPSTAARAGTRPRSPETQNSRSRNENRPPPVPPQPAGAGAATKSPAATRSPRSRPKSCSRCAGSNPPRPNSAPIRSCGGLAHHLTAARGDLGELAPAVLRGWAAGPRGPAPPAGRWCWWRWSGAPSAARR